MFPLIHCDNFHDGPDTPTCGPVVLMAVIVWISPTDHRLLQQLLIEGPKVSAKPPRWPSGKASASRAEGPGFESRLRRDFFGVESY